MGHQSKGDGHEVLWSTLVGKGRCPNMKYVTKVNLGSQGSTYERQTTEVFPVSINKAFVILENASM